MKYSSKSYGNKIREAYVMFHKVHSLFSEHLVPTPILRSTGSIAGGSFQIHFSPKPLKI